MIIYYLQIKTIILIPQIWNTYIFTNNTIIPGLDITILREITNGFREWGELIIGDEQFLQIDQITNTFRQGIKQISRQIQLFQQNEIADIFGEFGNQIIVQP